MKNIAYFFLSLFFILSITSPAQTKLLGLYTFNEAYRDMPIQVITPQGDTLTAKWQLTGYDRWLTRAEFKDLELPTDGRSCMVVIHFRDKDGDVKHAHFLLNDYDYSGCPLYIFISSITLAPAMASNGPIYNVPLIDQWYYPKDDIVLHPSVVQKTKEAKEKYYQNLKNRILIKRNIKNIG